MNKIVKLIKGTEADQKIARILLKKRPEVLKDLKIIIRYKSMRDYTDIAYTISRFDTSYDIFHFIRSYFYKDDDWSMASSDKYLPNKRKTNYLYNRALAALRRLKKDQY